MTEYVLRLTDKDLAVIDAALQDAPFRVAFPLIGKINSQIQPEPAPPAEDTPGYVLEPM